MAYGQVNADVIGTSVAGSNIGAGNASIMKNRIINGAMVIAQYGTSTSLGVSTNGYSCDRFRCDSSVGTAVTSSQVVDAPTGFYNSLKYTAGTGTTAAADIPEIVYFIEGYNVADLQFGTATAQTFTFSFWAKSSLTGTFGLIIENGATTRQYVTTYSLPVANTWTQITKTIVGDTSGTWLYTNGRGLGIRWDMGVGTTNSIAATNAWGNSSGIGVTGTVKITQNTGASFNITGVQLEVGSSATGFEYRIYGTEFINCQRYYQAITNNFWLSTIDSSAVYRRFNYVYPVVMRTAPTGTTAGTTSGTFAGGMPQVTNITAQSANIYGDLTGTSGYVNITSVTLSAEL
jgi:hypothetical protein